METSPCFRASDGRLLYKAETNLHHLTWRSDWYKTNQERKFRNATGMVIRLAIRSHNQLHREVEPPHKPNGESEQCQQNVEDAALLLENFKQQAPYIEQGRIEYVRA